ncbi:MAG: AAA family ATPase [Burkholderiaceae bacterium]|nr:AAA family ATPase [Burkholderiaceae bacterium]
MYEAFFGLQGKPFQLNPDPSFYFASRGHQRALSFLEYGVHQGEGFIVITGEVGAGKTTLLRGLLERLKDGEVVAAEIVSTQLEADDLLRQVAARFGVTPSRSDKSTLLSELSAFFGALHQQGRRALLVVDEAQNLGPAAVEELRMLSNFQLDSQSLVQSFLVGQPEFRAILQRPEMKQLKQRVIASYHLGPLDAQETRAYVEHRLGHVGWNGDPAFDEDAFTALHRATEGIPRRINTIADRLLLAAFLAERHDVAANDVEEIARELDDELGAPELEAGAASAGWPAAAAQAGVAAVRDAAMADRLARLEDRLALLEATSSMSQSTIRKVVRIVQGLAARDAAR